MYGHLSRTVNQGKDNQGMVDPTYFLKMMMKDEVACTHTDEGWCSTHNKQAKKKFRPKKVWTKGKSGLFGWRTGRVTYYTCLETTPIPADTPTFLMLKGSAGREKKASKTTSTGGSLGNQTKHNFGAISTTTDREVGRLSDDVRTAMCPADADSKL